MSIDSKPIYIMHNALKRCNVRRRQLALQWFLTWKLICRFTFCLKIGVVCFPNNVFLLRTILIHNVLLFYGLVDFFINIFYFSIKRVLQYYAFFQSSKNYCEHLPFFSWARRTQYFKNVVPTKKYEKLFPQ